MFRNTTTAAVAARSGRRWANQLFLFKGKALRGAVGLDFDVRRHGAEFAMHGFNRVFARGHVFDGDFPSAPLTAKYGLSYTHTHAYIQLCTSHWNFKNGSGLSNV